MTDVDDDEPGDDDGDAGSDPGVEVDGDPPPPPLNERGEPPPAEVERDVVAQLGALDHAIATAGNMPRAFTPTDPASFHPSAGLSGSDYYHQPARPQLAPQPM